MKKYILHHGDLDGYASAALLLAHLKVANTMEINYNKETEVIESLIEDFLSLGDKEVKVYFVDYCPSRESYNKIINAGAVVEVIDHHITNKEVFEGIKDVSIILKHDNGKNACGTSLVYDKYIKDTDLDNKAMEKFVELVRLYDTWDWSRENKIEAKDLNSVFYDSWKNKIKYKSIFEGKEECIFQFMLERINSNKDLFELTEAEKEIVKLKMVEARNYCKQKDYWKQVFEYDFKKFAFVMADRFINDISDYISEKNEDIDCVIIFNPSSNSFSLRSRVEGIDLTKYVKAFGGGGHPAACGYNITKQKREFMDITFIQKCFKDGLES